MNQTSFSVEKWLGARILGNIFGDARLFAHTLSAVLFVMQRAKGWSRDLLPALQASCNGVMVRTSATSRYPQDGSRLWRLASNSCKKQQDAVVEKKDVGVLTRPRNIWIFYFIFKGVLQQAFLLNNIPVLTLVASFTPQQVMYRKFLTCVGTRH